MCGIILNMKESGFNPEVTKNKQESEPVATTMNGRDFITEIFQGETILKNKKFFEFEKGGSFRFLYVDDILRNREDYYFSVVRVNGEIVAITQLKKNKYEGENAYNKSFTSVDIHFQGAGYASQVLEEVFRFAQEKKIKLINSSYNGEGELKLQKKNLELAKKYHVDFVDSKRMFK